MTKISKSLIQSVKVVLTFLLMASLITFPVIIFKLKIFYMWGKLTFTHSHVLEE